MKKKTTLEHFQDIKELEVADGPEITVEDLLPYKCEQVEKSLKALEIIIKKKVNILLLELAENVNEYNERIVPNGRLTEEEFDLLKEMLE